MVRRILIGLSWGIPSYLIGAFGGGYLLYGLSGNQHDPSVEAAMTGAFVFGPLASVIGLVIGLARGGARAE